MVLGRPHCCDCSVIDLLISKSALEQAARVSDIPHSKSSSFGQDKYGYIMVS